MKKASINKALRNAAKTIILSPILFAFLPLKAQDPSGPPPELIISTCPVNNPTFIPQIGIGNINKIVIGGNGIMMAPSAGIATTTVTLMAVLKHLICPQEFTL